jgi:hypothetical protein
MSAQMNAITPGSMLGGWMCIARRDPIGHEKDRRPKAPVQRIRRAACGFVHTTA